MTATKGSPALQSLLTGTLPIQDQISALTQIKHDIIGHDLKKEEAIRCGIVPVLVQGLRDSTSSIASRKQKAQDQHGTRYRSHSREDAWDHMDELRLRCCLVAASLARVGPSFASALIDGGILPPLLVSLTPVVMASRMIIETLRTIRVLAEILGINRRVQPRSACETLCRELYSQPVLDDFTAILSQTTDSPGYGEQANLITQIISETLKEPEHQSAVIRAGLLDLLASRLASYMRTTSQATHPAQSLDPSLPIRKNSLAPLLYAITRIIGTSFYRTARLMYAEDVRVDLSRHNETNQDAGFGIAGQTDFPPDPLDALLPRLQAVENRAEQYSRKFPALTTLSTTGFQTPATGIVASARTIAMDDYGSPIIAWLVYLARVCEKTDRLAALWLLVHILKNVHVSEIDGFADAGNRDRSLAVLIVPLLVRMLEDAVPKPGDKITGDAESDYLTIVRERAPRALARLTEHHKELQKTAVEAGAIKIVSQILKKSFDAIPESAKQKMWNPTPNSSVDVDQSEPDFVQTPDFCIEQVHRLQYRSAALECLAALAQKEDANRKIIIESGVLQCIVDSLIPIPSTEPISTSTKGNPPMVLTRACQLTAALSRSVSVLRTSLIDGGVLTPIFNLLSHPRMGVKLAATAVVTNFLLQFSPMREDLVKAGVVDILCAHSHSSNMDLAHGSLWALKHLLNNCSDEIKMEVLDKLGPDWLLQAMAAELRVRGGPGVEESDGRRQSLERDDNIVMESGESSEVEAEHFDGDDIVMGERNSFRPTNHGLSNEEVAARLRTIYRVESSKARKARKDQSRMQVQALDVVRNLISEANPSQGVMVQYVLDKFGVDRLFGNLEKNMASRIPSEPTANLDSPSPLAYISPMPGGSPNPNAFHNHPPTVRMPPPLAALQGTEHQPSNQTTPDVLISTLFILIHIANGKPPHRRLMISRAHLIHLIIPLFQYPDSRIRTSCCWIIHNLCWQDDSSDAVSLRGRIADLRALGVEDAVLKMAKDRAVDTRERARQIVDVFARFPRDEARTGEGLNFASTREGIAGGARGWER